MNGYLFEQQHGRHVWRLETVEWNGSQRLQVWPWYSDKQSGELRPCAARFGGGFAIPVERVPELITALSSIAPGGG
jgi:hypothetical protein